MYIHRGISEDSSDTSWTPVEQFEARASQSTVPSPPLIPARRRPEVMITMLLLLLLLLLIVHSPPLLPMGRVPGD